MFYGFITTNSYLYVSMHNTIRMQSSNSLANLFKNLPDDVLTHVRSLYFFKECSSVGIFQHHVCYVLFLDVVKVQ